MWEATQILHQNSFCNSYISDLDLVKAMADYWLNFFPVLQSYIIALLTFELYIVRLLSLPQESFLCIWPSLLMLGKSSSGLVEISNQEIPIKSWQHLLPLFVPSGTLSVILTPLSPKVSISVLIRQNHFSRLLPLEVNSKESGEKLLKDLIRQVSRQ